MGLSKFREGLEPLEPFTQEDAKYVLEQIHGWQEKIFPEYGLHFVHASDEWYILAGEKMPPEETYDGYLQLENGVGMIRLMLEEFEDASVSWKNRERWKAESWKGRIPPSQERSLIPISAEWRIVSWNGFRRYQSMFIL